MGRTRAAVIDGAVRAVEKHGSRKATMADVAALAGVAKATLYNHFRTKRDVYAATIEAEVQALGTECARVATDEGLVAGLVRAAERLASHPAIRRVAADEPAVLALLQTPTAGPAWGSVRTSVAEVLRAGRSPAAPAEVETVLRWLVSFLGSPGSSDDRQTGARTLATGLTPAGPPSGWHRAPIS